MPKKMPLVLYGLHFSPGVAEYAEGKDSYRILINENVAKKMDPTFVGKPLYVEHVDEVDMENLQHEADGWVLESFFNQLDGKHWVKFILVSDAAQEAYRRGYKLSNAYVPKSFAGGGQWHGVSYQKEVMEGEYEHLALVKDPRYAESIILSSEEFKQYNEGKKQELQRLANSKEEKSEMKFNIFRRTKVENSKDVDFAEMEVELPKSKKIVTLAACVDGYDKVVNMSGYAANEHMVKVNEKMECSVADLVKKHNDLEMELEKTKKKENEVPEEMEIENAADEETEEEVVENESDEKSEVEVEEVVEEKPAVKNAKPDPKNFEKLKNANRSGAVPEEAPQVMLLKDRVAVGRTRYGSGN